MNDPIKRETSDEMIEGAVSSIETLKKQWRDTLEDAEIINTADIPGAVSGTYFVDLKSLLDTLSQVKYESPSFGKSLASYQTAITIDVTKILYLLGMTQHILFTKLMENKILNPKGGFPQEDGTYALYGATYKDLKHLSTVTWDNLSRESQEVFIHQGKKLLGALVSQIIEK